MTTAGPSIARALPNVDGYCIGADDCADRLRVGLFGGVTTCYCTRLSSSAAALADESASA